MAIPLTCGECGKQFKVKDEHAGRKTRCTRCDAMIRIPGEKVGEIAPPPVPPPIPKAANPPPSARTPAPPPPPPEMPVQRAMTVEQPRAEFDFDDPVDEPPVRFGSSRQATVVGKKGNWRSLGSGFTMVAIGGCIIGLCVLLMMLLPHLVDPEDGFGALMELLNWMMGIVVLTLVGFIVGLLGRLGQNAPDASTRGLASASGILAMIATGLWAVVVILLVVVRLQISSGAGPGTEKMLQIIPFVFPVAILLAFIGEAIHARMLAKVNGLFRRDGLAVYATVMFIVFLVQGVAFTLITLISVIQAADDDGDGLPGMGGSQTLATVQQIAWLAATIAYVVLLFLSRGVVAGGSPPPPRRSRRLDEDDDPPPRRRERERERERDDRDRGRPSRRPRDDYDD